METLSDEIIAARAGWSRELKRGQVLRLIDLEGRQAVDFLCYNARDHEDRYAAADTMKINGNIFIRKGSVIYSVHGAASPNRATTWTCAPKWTCWRWFPTARR